VQPAVFLDRDGTMIHDVGYLSRHEDVRWYPASLDAIRLLTRAGFLVCVTTNQGGIGLGFYTEAFLRSVHTQMDDTVRASGGRIGGWYFCPHHPNARIEPLRVACDCRKPGPGMIRQARSEHAIDLSRSFVVGDKIADVGLGAGVGAQSILVKTGYGQATLSRYGGDPPGAAYVAEELMDAAEWILKTTGFPRERA
jgi:D-glycero-D-manno-heptose 1,7-bisphosphate phosphatase